jgi:hypothetical protein
MNEVYRQVIARNYVASVVLCMVYQDMLCVTGMSNKLVNRRILREVLGCLFFIPNRELPNCHDAHVQSRKLAYLETRCLRSRDMTNTTCNHGGYLERRYTAL